MAVFKHPSARGNVIQGRFIDGQPSLTGGAAPAAVQPRMAGVPPVQPAARPPFPLQRQPAPAAPIPPHARPFGAAAPAAVQPRMAGVPRVQPPARPPFPLQRQPAPAAPMPQQPRPFGAAAPAAAQPRMVGAPPVQPAVRPPFPLQRQPAPAAPMPPHARPFGAAAPAAAQPRMAGAPPLPMPQAVAARAGHPHTVQARPAAPQGPVVQRFANGEAFQLPANLAHFGSGGGQPLPKPVLQKMEAFFNTSFADVRVHVGPQAAAIGALAFTQGSNVYFAPGQYNPQSQQGQQLLGHELAHVVQQRAGRVRNPFASGIAVVQDRALEAEADRLGTRAAMHWKPIQAKIVDGRINARVAPAPGFVIQKKFRRRVINITGIVPIGGHHPTYKIDTMYYKFFYGLDAELRCREMLESWEKADRLSIPVPKYKAASVIVSENGNQRDSWAFWSKDIGFPENDGVFFQASNAKSGTMKALRNALNDWIKTPPEPSVKKIKQLASIIELARHNLSDAQGFFNKKTGEIMFFDINNSQKGAHSNLLDVPLEFLNGELKLLAQGVPVAAEEEHKE
jgi:hypothetical protein